MTRKGTTTKAVGSKRHLKHSAGASAQYDDERVVEPVREPRSPLVGPPRPLKKGDRLAIAGGQYGDVDLWTARTFVGFDEAGRMHVEVVDPTERMDGNECYWVTSYGDETGRNADLGIVFYRLASDPGIRFWRRCPDCRGYSRVIRETVLPSPLFENRTRLESGEVDCETCNTFGKIVDPDPWTSKYPYVKAWNTGYKAMPTALSKTGKGAPDGHVIVGIRQGEDGVIFDTMPKEDVDRLKAERAAAAAKPVAMTEEFG